MNALLPPKSVIEDAYLGSLAEQRSSFARDLNDAARVRKVLEEHTAAWRLAFGEMHRGDAGWPRDGEVHVLDFEASLLKGALAIAGGDQRTMLLLMNAAMLARHTTHHWRDNTPLTNVVGVHLRAAAHPTLATHTNAEPAAAQPSSPPPRAAEDQAESRTNDRTLRHVPRTDESAPIAQTSGELILGSWSQYTHSRLRPTIGHWIVCYSPELTTLAFYGDDNMTFREVRAGDITSVRTAAKGINLAAEVMTVDGTVFVLVAPRNRARALFAHVGFQLP